MEMATFAIDVQRACVVKSCKLNTSQARFLQVLFNPTPTSDIHKCTGPGCGFCEIVLEYCCEFSARRILCAAALPWGAGRARFQT